MDERILCSSSKINSGIEHVLKTVFRGGFRGSIYKIVRENSYPLDLVAVRYWILPGFEMTGLAVSPVEYMGENCCRRERVKASDQVWFGKTEAR